MLKVGDIVVKLHNTQLEGQLCVVIELDKPDDRGGVTLAPLFGSRSDWHYSGLRFFKFFARPEGIDADLRAMQRSTGALC